MIRKVMRYMAQKLENFRFKVFSKILKKYGVDFYFKDTLGILTKRNPEDNFQYIFKTGYSCDAIPLMLSLDEKIKKSRIGFDIGANIGITSIWMAKNSGIVYSFEPEPNNIQRFKQNLSINFINNVNIINKAVSDIDGQAELFLYESYGHHSLADKHVSNVLEKINVETVMLDTFCKDHNILEIDVLKVDVEGYELNVLNGCKELLLSGKIHLIIFEHSPILFRKQQRELEQVIKYLMGMNYEIYRLDNTVVSLSDVPNLGQQDLYAIPKKNNIKK